MHAINNRKKIRKMNTYFDWFDPYSLPYSLPVAYIQSQVSIGIHQVLFNYNVMNYNKVKLFFTNNELLTLIHITPLNLLAHLRNLPSLN